MEARLSKRLTERREALEFTKRLVGAYGKVGLHDPQAFIESLTAFLVGYPADHVAKVFDTRAGIQTKYEFLPTIAAIRKALEAVAEEDRKYDDFKFRWEGRRVIRDTREMDAQVANIRELVDEEERRSPHRDRRAIQVEVCRRLYPAAFHTTAIATIAQRFEVAEIPTGMAGAELSKELRGKMGLRDRTSQSLAPENRPARYPTSQNEPMAASDDFQGFAP